eukprot:scaffold194303_cov35-Tisochrysis_lutea.AAC.2
MSRSGTSLTTSIVASLLRSGQLSDQTWRGEAAAYPTDRLNKRGYFERHDVVNLNYKTIYEATGEPWIRFPAGFAAHPTLLNFTDSAQARTKRANFVAAASKILREMDVHAPWVLKDVRFGRTLPLWWPLLRQPVCIIPYRHPLEVAESSKLHSVRLWENYITAALTSTQALGCPTVLISYAQWLDPTSAQAQLTRLNNFLRCAQVCSRHCGAAAPRFIYSPRLVLPLPCAAAGERYR